jgi:hypothetical protein
MLKNITAQLLQKINENEVSANEGRLSVYIRHLFQRSEQKF